MDLADVFRTGLQNLHKNVLDKNYKKRSLLSRKESMVNERRQTRDTVLFGKRNIHINMSPFITPKPNKTTEQQEVTQQKKQKNEQRYEMLKQWQVKRNKQKEEEKKRAKPVFKVFHVDRNIGLPDLENVNKEIKGKLIKPLRSFAPVNHTFKAPKSIKPSTILKPVSRKNQHANIAVPVRRVNSQSNIKVSGYSQSRTSDLRNGQKKPSVEEKTKKVNQHGKVSAISASTNRANPKKGNSSIVSKSNKTPKMKKHKDIANIEDNSKKEKSGQNYKKLSAKKTRSPNTILSSVPVQIENLTDTEIANDITNQIETVTIYDDDELTLKTPVKRRKSRASTIKTPKSKRKQKQSSSVTISGGKHSTRKAVNSAEPIDIIEDMTISVQNIVIYDDDEITLSTPVKRRKSRAKTPQSKLKRQQSSPAAKGQEFPGTELDSAEQTDNIKDMVVENVVIYDDEEITLKTPVKRRKSRATATKSQMDEDKQSVYISPFVTISRGKDSAKKEFKLRQSTGGTYFKSPDGKDVLNSTSPHAGAIYFENILDNHIAKIRSICDIWQKYQTDNHLPEEANDMIDVTVGQSKLLIAKKFQQFRNLILQCKSMAYEEKPITCEDLHGFWDMIYQQVVDLNKRFDNLEKLKINNWQEILSEKKVVRKRGRPPTKKPATASSSSIRDMVKAARMQMKNTDHVVEVQLLAPRTPNHLKTILVPRTSSAKKSSRLSLLKDFSGNREPVTPSKSILKTDLTKSAKNHRKSVFFMDTVNNSESMDFSSSEDKENIATVTSIGRFGDVASPGSFTPLRRSRRLMIL